MLNIQKIDSIYRITTKTWQRPTMQKRHTNGLIYFEKGSIEYYCQSSGFIAKEGDLLFLHKGFAYSGKKLTESQAFYVIDFESDDFCDRNIFSTIIHTEFPEKTKKEFESILNLWNNKTSEGYLLCMSKLYKLMAQIIKTLPENDNSITPLMKSVLAYIDSNISDPTLCFAKLCENFNISPAQLRRYFQKDLGISPVNYITEKRIKLACTYLNEENMAIKEISNLCGYNSDYYFSRVFHKIMGYSPTSYNKFKSGKN